MAAPVMQLVDGTGKAVDLGRMIAQGGEGGVYEVPARVGMLAKVYHKPPDQDRVDKLRLMASLKNDQLASLAAWPMGLLQDRSTLSAAGFLMPKVVDRKDVHTLYGPKSRMAEFPKADWRFLVRTAANIARAFHVVHEAGAVIGDVNHSGLLVGQDATVRLIDCDSFQIQAGGRHYPCIVGTPEFTPPELQGASWARAIRTTNHDAFGLALLIFQLLFMGRHPFSGRYSGAGDMPIEKAISEQRFAYGASASSRQMSRPPHTPSLDIVGIERVRMFEKAFVGPGARPSAKEWVEALGRLEGGLRQCPSNSGHWHLSPGNCPWCAMEASIGFYLFPVSIPKAPATAFVTFNLADFMDRLSKVADPTKAPMPSLVPSTITPSMSVVAQRKEIEKAQRTWGFMAFCSVGFFLWVATAVGSGWPLVLAAGSGLYCWARRSSNENAVGPLRSRISAAQIDFDRATQQWADADGNRRFLETRTEIDRMLADWHRIPQERVTRLADLKRNHRHLQMEAFLDQFRIDKANIDGIKAGRKKTLQSFGIETAADVTPANLAPVPGFGKVFSGTLLAWRAQKEKRFVFNENQQMDPKHAVQVEKEMLDKRIRLDKALNQSLAELSSASSKIAAERQRLRPELQAAEIELQQAKVDLAALTQ